MASKALIAILAFFIPIALSPFILSGFAHNPVAGFVLIMVLIVISIIILAGLYSYNSGPHRQRY